jgi:hypothetical protein
MPMHNLRSNAQAQPETRRVPARVGRAVRPVEDPRHDIRGDSDPMIAHAEHGVFAINVHRHFDRAAAW